MPPRYPLASVDHALRIIELLRAQPAMRLSDVARELDVANSTAHRLLAALAHRGFVEQLPDSRLYVVGTTLIDIGRTVALLGELQARARPLLEGLGRELGETIHLGVREGRSVRYLDAVESPRAVRVAARTGRRLDAHCSSIGKVLLAALEEASIRRLLGDKPLPAGTTKSIATVEKLLIELAVCRERGFAVNCGESEEDVVAVAVPLRDHVGVTVAGVGCAAPQYRMTVRDAERVGARMIAIVGESDFAADQT